MNRARSFQPGVCPLEGRAALSGSLSLSGFLHSIFPFVPNSARGKTPAEVAKHKAVVDARHAIIAEHRAARLAHVEAIRAQASTHLRAVIA